NTVRLLEMKWTRLTRTDGAPDLLRSAATLKMCSAFEAYRRFYAAPVEPSRVVEFLLLNPSFPRSALWASARVAEESRRIARHGSAGRGPERLFGQLRAQLEYASVDELGEGGLAPFLQLFRRRAWEAEQLLTRAFFLRDERPPAPG